MWDKIVKGLAAAAGAISALIGEWHITLTILVVIMAMDYLTGLIVAACGKSPKSEKGGLSSKVGFIGLAKKAFIMLVVLLATLLDRALGDEKMIFQMATTFYYIANEGLSILENAALLGVPYPKKIKQALESMKEKNSETNPPEDPEE